MPNGKLLAALLALGPSPATRPGLRREVSGYPNDATIPDGGTAGCVGATLPTYGPPEGTRRARCPGRSLTLP